MPPRLNKRQQREQEELAALGSQEDTEQNDANLHPEDEKPAAKLSSFAAVRSRFFLSDLGANLITKQIVNGSGRCRRLV